MKPLLVMDQMGTDGRFRRLEELFTPADFGRLERQCEIAGGVNWAMPAERLASLLPEAHYFVGMNPRFDRARLAAAPNLKAIIEVGGHFPPGIDYAACDERGVEVLSCSPGFRESVAEMALGMMIAGGRGLVEEHLAFRGGYEHWYADHPESDFSLYRQRIGFIGFGSISREIVRLMQPFAPIVSAYDPWLDPAVANEHGAELVDLETLVSSNRCVVVAATPTDENKGLLSSALIDRMPRGTLVVVISRAHLVDFPALTAAASARRIRLATDVFPVEPIAHDDPVRTQPNTILSPHRAAAVEGGRRLIGQMIADDIEAMIAGSDTRRLLRARPEFVHHMVGGHAGALAGRPAKTS